MRAHLALAGVTGARHACATPTPADEHTSLNAYRAAWTRAQRDLDRPLAMRTAAGIRNKPWPTMRAFAESLAHEIDRACFGDGDLSYEATEAREAAKTITDGQRVSAAGRS